MGDTEKGKRSFTADSADKRGSDLQVRGGFQISPSPAFKGFGFPISCDFGDDVRFRRFSPSVFRESNGCPLWLKILAFPISVISVNQW